MIIEHNVKLIIIDSIAALARTDFNTGRMMDRQRMLGTVLEAITLLELFTT